jgi:methylphosphotriester-DNA--protein-cysteine methyltransferase
MFDKPNIVEAPAGQDPRWRVVALRDRTFDGQFYYAVKTTASIAAPPALPAPPGQKTSAFIRAARTPNERASVLASDASQTR